MTALSRYPRRKLAVVTCMDCRIEPLAVAGVELGDAHVIRNAGALVTDDVRRSLALSQRALGTREVWLVMHTGCGVQDLDEEAFLAEVEEEAGERPDWRPGTFSSLEAELRAGASRIAADRTLDSTAVRGFILDIETGSLDEVDLGLPA